MPTDPLATLYFEDFALDRRAGELRQRNRPVALPRQQFQLLLALTREPGTLVTRDELRAQLWDAADFVDFDAGLNFCVRQLRLALGDSAGQPRFILTLPRRGYRFIAAVRTSAAAPGPQSPARRRPAIRVAAAVALALAGGAAGAFAVRAASPPAVTAEARIADAHAARGFVALNDDWAWDTAERAFERALQLEPDHEVALISMSRLRASQGDIESATTFARSAVAAHPDSARARVTLGWALLFGGDPAAARAACNHALGELPASSAARICRLNADLDLGLVPKPTILRILANANVGRPGGSTPYFLRATLEARLGHVDTALADLARALEARDPDASFAAVHPAFAALRADARFAELLRASGLAQH